VLLISCINIASILLARARTRTPELAVRTALGAGRSRLIRQLLVESALLATLGALTGLLMGYVGSRILLGFGPDSLKGAESALNLQTVAFTIGVAFLSTFLFGTVPALASTKMGMAASARGASKTLRGRRRERWWGWVVGVEVALAVVLVAEASLLAKSLQKIVNIDPGIRTESLIAADLALPRSSFPDDGSLAAFFEGLENQLKTLPGAQSVGTVNRPPLLGHSMSSGFEVEGQDESEWSLYKVASASYFETMNMSILRGRGIEHEDPSGKNDVVVINEALARRLWPEEDPLGKRIRNFGNDRWAYEGRWATVVGVVSDVRETGLMEAPPPTVYLPVDQRPLRAREATVFVKVMGNPTDQVDRIRTTIRAFHPDVAVEVRPFQTEVDRSMARERFLSLVSIVFATLALVLACVGVFGVVSYSVAQRTFEIGIRVALGASGRSIIQGAAASMLRSVALGVGGGILGAYALSRVLKGLLFGVGGTDPWALLFSAAILLMCGTVAAVIPAWRGTRLNPLEALRTE
jgi:predicted permease